MQQIIHVEPLDNYFIRIAFADNFTSIINIKPFLNKGISIELNDIQKFKTVKVDDFGGIVWENGFDFCPNYLRSLAELKLEFNP